jgi:N-acetyl-gamma-glutamyl-phosphate reductase
VIKASIIGATGYTGAVLTDILSQHPEVEMQRLTSKSFVGKRVAEVFPRLRVDAEYSEYTAESVTGSDVAFVCYPHAESHPVVAKLVEAGCRVVDLSADFRLKDPAAYGPWYGFDHPRGDLVKEAVFGLPEKYRAEIKSARLIANPGCYPTAMLLSLLPVASAIGDSGVIVDSKSGVSGAGRTPSAKTHFCEVTGDFKAYSEVGHRHTAEMAQELSLVAGKQVSVSFTPHLLPVDRGIFSTVYFRPSGALPGTAVWLTKYAEFYQDEPYVEVCEHMPTLAEVVGTNFCRLTVREDTSAGLVKVFAVIDNLVKGASGQAVQNMNCMFGFAETLGLGRKV